MKAAAVTGYSATPLAKKLGVVQASRLCPIAAPTGYPDLLAPLPPDVSFESKASDHTDIVHLFVVQAAELGKQLAALRKTLKPTAVIWVSWPKKASRVATDITEDTIRELALPLGFVDVKVCAVTQVWSGLKLVVRKELRVSPTRPRHAPHTGVADTSKAVDEFMNKLDHPLKTEVQAIRRTVLGVDPGIAEGIKWNAPSYRTSEYFATTNLREKAGVGVILHLGAKVRGIGPEGVAIRDPEGLLKWLAKDRAMVVFRDMKDFTARRAAFEDIVRQWISRV